FLIPQQGLEVGGNARRLELAHDEGIELVVDHALALQLLDLLAVEGRGVVAEDNHQAVGIIGGKDRFGLAGIQLVALFHWWLNPRRFNRSPASRTLPTGKHNAHYGARPARARPPPPPAPRCCCAG